ncbi:MAG TPA: hypothetical protein VKF15_03415 [Nitrososphaerales archaeon]|nr:hypothetical protein [Nitrososphaerales archaeon]
MNVDRPTAVLTGVVVAAFLFLYAEMGWLIASSYLFPLTLVEAVVLSTQLIRIVVVLAVRRLRNASPFSILDFLSLETFAFPVLGLLGLVTGSGIYRDLGLQVIFGWTVSLLLLSPSIMIFRFARSMSSGAPLSVLLPYSAVLFGVLGSLQGLPAPPPGAGGPSALFGIVLGSPLGVPSASLRADSSGLAAAAVVTFFALTVYASTSGSGRSAMRTAALAVALAGALGALGWEFACARLTTNPLILLTLPTAAVGGTLWWVTRGTRG